VATAAVCFKKETTWYARYRYKTFTAVTAIFSIYMYIYMYIHIYIHICTCNIYIYQYLEENNYSITPYTRSINHQQGFNNPGLTWFSCHCHLANYIRVEASRYPCLISLRARIGSWKHRWNREGLMMV
jgi:hypothetical protein